MLDGRFIALGLVAGLLLAAPQAAAAQEAAAQEAEEAAAAAEDVRAVQEGEVLTRQALEEATERAARERGDEARRDAVLSVVRHPEVRSVGAVRGLDMTRVEDAVATLDGAELEELSQRAQLVEDALAGGDRTIVISTTTLIIALLVLIIILVA